MARNQDFAKEEGLKPQVKMNASPHPDLGISPSTFERWMIRGKRPIRLEKNHFNRRRRPVLFGLHPIFGEKVLAKTFFFFGLHSISSTELRNLH